MVFINVKDLEESEELCHPSNVAFRLINSSQLSGGRFSEIAQPSEHGPGPWALHSIDTGNRLEYQSELKIADNLPACPNETLKAMGCDWPRFSGRSS